jgi:hypothetical protein
VLRGERAGRCAAADDARALGEALGAEFLAQGAAGILRGAAGVP